MKKTVNILILMVVFLIGTNVAVIINYQNHLRKERKVMMHRVEMPDFQSGQYFRDALQLNEEQVIQFRQYRQSYNRQANRVLSDMQTIRHSMLKQLESVKPNPEKLHSLSDDLGNKHKELKELTFEYYFNLQSVLDPEQQKIMVDIFQAMLTYEGYAETPDHHQGGPRRGGQQGQGGRYQEPAVSDTSKYIY